MPMEKDFNLLCEIVCRKHGEAMNLKSARETSKLKGQSEYFGGKISVVMPGSYLPSSIQELTPLGISPREDFCQDLTSSPPLHLAKVRGLERASRDALF